VTYVTAAGVTKAIWSIADLEALLLPPVAAKRGPYKKGGEGEFKL